MKISEVLKHFIEEEITNGSTKLTIRHYDTHIKFFIKFFGDKDINKINYSTYQKYIEYLRTKYKESSGFKGKQEYLSSRTVKTYASALKTFLSYAYKNGYLKENISANIKLPRYKKKVIQILNISQIKTLVNSFDLTSFNGCRDLFIVSIMLDTGARLSEVAKLKCCDFDFEKEVIKLDGKGQKERFVPLTPFIKSSYNIYMNKYITSFRTDLEYRDILIRTYNNDAITKNTISLMFRRLRKKININIHPHLLRHTFATTFLLNGGDISSLQIILGHTTLHMVLQYLHLAQQLNVSSKIKYSPLTNIYNMYGQKEKLAKC